MSNSLPEEGSGQELFHGTGAACAKALRFSEHSTWLDYMGQGWSAGVRLVSGDGAG